MRNVFTPKVNRKILIASAVFSILWGIIITFLPEVLLNFFGVQGPLVIEFWQIFGMALAVMGIAQIIASFDPGKHWPIILVGFLVSLMGTFVFSKSLILGTLPTNFSLLLLFSSAIWVVPFYHNLLMAYEENTSEESSPKKFNDLIKYVRTSQNITLDQLSKDHNVLLVFVRHFGCTFCRETVSEIAKIDDAIKGKNLTLVFVHMSDPAYGDEFFSKYYEHPVHHISDPARLLYKSLNLKRGTLYQLFGPMTWIRGVIALCKGHGGPSLEGDTLQLGGVFVLSHGQIVFEQKANSASHIFQFKTLPEL